MGEEQVNMNKRVPQLVLYQIVVRGSDRIISVRGCVLGVTYLKINYMKI